MASPVNVFAKLKIMPSNQSENPMFTKNINQFLMNSKAMSYAQSDLDGFEAFIASAPSAAGVTPPQDNLYAATHAPGGQGESFDVVKMAVGGAA